MHYLHCTFTLVMTDGSALTPGTGPVVPTKRPHAVSPLHIPTSLDGGCALTEGPVPVVPTIRRHAVYSLDLHTCLAGRCALNDEPGTALTIKLPH